MNLKSRIAILLLCALLCVFSGVALAHDVPDESQSGTIIVEMKYDGNAVSGGQLMAYRVARIAENDGNFGFEALEPYDVGEINQENISTPELAAAFAEQISGEGIEPTVSEAGLVRFENLELGLYLIVQTEAAEGFEPLNPFLVSVPTFEDGHYVYEVNAEGKFQLHQETPPTETPTESPTNPGLPQTGQLNWPIPLLAVLGLGLFSIGWALRFGRKKSNYEE